MTTTGGGRPTREQRRAQKARDRGERIARLIEEFETLDLDMAERCVARAKDEKLSGAVQLQNEQILLQLRERMHLPTVSRDVPESPDIDAARSLLARIWGPNGLGWKTDETGRDLTVVELKEKWHAEADAAIAERDRLRAAVAELDALRARLESAELRDLVPPVTAQPAAKSPAGESAPTEPPAPPPGIVQKDGFSLGDPAAPWNGGRGLPPSSRPRVDFNGYPEKF